LKHTQASGSARELMSIAMLNLLSIDDPRYTLDHYIHGFGRTPFQGFGNDELRRQGCDSRIAERGEPI
jgi:hypothetical protein